MAATRQDRTTAVVIRSIYGTAAVEWFVIFAIGTILVTRLYLQLTGYPQVGGGSLHIAHALWGGALMMLASLIGWLFLGPAMRVAAIVSGGIGFGLFLDEIGKFVTKTNDYFYGPSAEIMYVLVVVVLVAGRLVRDLRRPTQAEAMANAAAIAADGISHGLPERRRRQALALLDHAAADGADPETVGHVRGLLAASADTPDRLMRLRDRAVAAIPDFLRRPVLLRVVGWLLVVSSASSTLVVTLGLALNDRDLGELDLYFDLPDSSTATAILLVSSVVAFLLALPAMLALPRTDALWPLRALRMSALVSTLANALVEFALDGFGALTNLALGLGALVIISYHLGQRAAETPGRARGQLEV